MDFIKLVKLSFYTNGNEPKIIELIDIDPATVTGLMIKAEAAMMPSRSLKSSHDYSFFYCGVRLKPNENLDNYGIRDGSIIQVMDNANDMYGGGVDNKEKKDNPIMMVREPTKNEIESTMFYYKRSHSFMAESSYAKNLRPELLRKLLRKFPKFYNEMGAFAILKDSIMMEEMLTSDLEIVERTIKKYPFLMECAEFVYDTTKEYATLSKDPRALSYFLPGGDESDSSIHSDGDASTTTDASTSEDVPTAGHVALQDAINTLEMAADATRSSSSSSSGSAISPPRDSDNIRRISREQLSAALLRAGLSSSNSLANIAQRLLSDENSDSTFSNTATSSSVGNYAPHSTVQSPLSQIVTPAASVTGTTAAAASATGRMVAVQEVEQSLNTTTNSSANVSNDNLMDTSSNNENNAMETNDERVKYQHEMNIMHEMGLMDDSMNYQALFACNGDVSAAIHLVLESLNNS